VQEVIKVVKTGSKLG